jgi:outer membrane protein assembly factor BamD (BamD/ComL family)
MARIQQKKSRERQLAMYGLVIVCCLADGALAQPPRARTLTFDPDKRQWVEEAPPAPGTPEGELYQMRTLIARQRYKNALDVAKSFAKTYGRDNPYYPDMLIALADAQIGMRDFDAAHKTLQEFLGEFGGMTLTEEALRMEHTIAEAYLAGAKRKVWRIFRVSGKDFAYRMLDQISAGYPDSVYAELAVKTKADHLFKEGEYSLAELEYARLLRDYPQTRYHQFALRRTADAALASFGGVDYDEAALIEAEERYREYRARYPAAAQREGIDVVLEGIRESRAEKEFAIGRYYEHTRHLNTAVFYYDLVRREWPGTIAATKAADRLARIDAAVSMAPTGS